jgi:hypothetical protein
MHYPCYHVNHVSIGTVKSAHCNLTAVTHNIDEVVFAPQAKKAKEEM